MKFISEQTQLLKAINSVINGISSKRDTILEGILIQTLDNSIKFNNNNLISAFELHNKSKYCGKRKYCYKSTYFCRNN